MRLNFLGVAPASFTEKLKGRLKDLTSNAVVIPAGPVCAICETQSAWRPALQRLFGRAPADYQHTLALQETALETAPFLPASAAKKTLTRQAFVPILREYRDSLHDALEEYGKLVQYQVTTSWDTNAVIDEIEEAGKLPRALSLPPGPLLDAHKRDISAALKGELKQRKKSTADIIIKTLGRASEMLAPLTSHTDEIIVTATVIVKREGVRKFAHALSYLASDLGIGVKTVGPSPAAAFISLDVVDTHAHVAERARRVFDLPTRTTRGDVKAAYYRELKRLHPDTAPRKLDVAKIARMQDAYEILTAIADLQGARDAASPVDLTHKPSSRYALRLRRTPTDSVMATFRSAA